MGSLKFNSVFLKSLLNFARNKFTYVQGQSSPISKAKREYFYFIDHRGQLFLDDTKIKNFTTCFKEKKFLKFFFERVKRNEKYSYKDDFPFISPCGLEMNYIRSEELPIVYNKVVTVEEAKSLEAFKKIFKNSQTSSNGYLLYAGDQLWTPFEPSKLSVNPESGRLYHPCSDHLGGVALIASALASELSSRFHYHKTDSANEDMFLQPSTIHWNNQQIQIDQNSMVLVHKAEACRSK